MKFSVTNYKGIDEVEITATDGDLVLVAGKNGSGKSSFIDAITELFDARGVRLTPKPIRDGETKAIAEFEHEGLDVRVRRTWTKDDGGKLEVHALDGAKYPKPADVLAKLTGGLIFDPGRFLHLDEKRQRDELLAKVALPFDLDELERKAAGARERRLEAGREVKRLHGALASLPRVPDGMPVVEVSASAIVDELRAAERAHDERDEMQIRAAVARGRADEIRQEIADMQRELERVTRDAADVEFELSTAPDLPDVDAIRGRLAAVDETNEAVRVAKHHADLAAALSTAESDHAKAEADLGAIDEQKRAGMKAATWPDPDLGVDEGGVTLDGIPFRQVNTARRILAAARIATSGDPDLKLVIVSNGDLLDAESLEAVHDLAEARGFTVLMERDRDESRQVGVEIREGRRVA